VADGRTGGLRLRLLGGFQLWQGDRLVLDDSWPRRKARSLLKIVALQPGRAVHREVLLDLLWPTLSEPAAANNLRQSMHQIRLSLVAAGADEACVAVTGSTVSLATTAAVDIDRFVEAAETAGALRTSQAAYQRALDAWGGELLPGDRYEPWAEAHRDRLSALWQRCLLECGLLLELRGDAPRAIALLEELLQYDPLNEAAVGCLMRALAESGHRHRAIAQYEQWVARLRDELSISPAPAMIALREQVGGGQPVARDVRGTGQPFIGREMEMAALRACIDAGFRGRGGVALVTGEPGIGKTETVREAATYARLRGARVFWGRCYEGEGAPPYWPWLQVLRMIGEQAERGELSAVIGRDAPELARLLPELRGLLPGVAAEPSDESDQARFRLFESVTAFLRRSAHRQPAVIVIEDIQGADEASLRLLEFAARTVLESPVLLLATCRDEGHRSAALSQAVADLVRIPEVVSLSLAPLTPDEVRELVEAATGGSCSPEVASTVHRQSGGNVFFVTELVRLMAKSGDGASVAVSSTVRDVVAQRVSQLSAPSRRLLTVAAVLGTEFALNVLRRTAELDVDDLLPDLEHAITAGIVREDPGKVGRYRFVHALLRDSLYDELSLEARGDLHSRIVAAYESVYDPIPEDLTAEVAHHAFAALSAGGDAARAVTYKVRSAVLASRMLAHEEAVRCYRQALEADALRPQPDRATRCDLLLRMAWAEVAAGRRSDAAATARDALALARRLGDADLLQRASMILLPRVAWDEPPSDNAEVISLLEEIHAALAGEASARHADVLSRLAIELRHDPASATRRRELSAEAVRAARASDDGGILAQVLVGDLYMNAESLTIDERLARATEATRAAKAACARSPELQSRGWRIDSYLRLGDMPRAHAEMDAYRASAEAFGEAAYLWISGLMTTMRSTMAGRLDEAEGLVMESLASIDRAQFANGMVAIGAQMLVLRIEQGRYAEMASIAERFSRRDGMLPSVRAGLSLLYAYDGRLDEARRHFEHLAAEEFRTIPHHLYNGHTDLSRLAEVCAALGDRRRAAQLYEMLAPYGAYNITAMVGLICLGSVSRTLGILAATLAHWDDAERHFADALAMNEQIGAVAFAVRTRVDHAEALQRRGRPVDLARADAMLAEALSRATELKLPGLIARIRATAACAPCNPPTTG
jgi:DNA-binding SARP family transcriptional activator